MYTVSDWKWDSGTGKHMVSVLSMAWKKPNPGIDA